MIIARVGIKEAEDVMSGCTVNKTINGRQRIRVFSASFIEVCVVNTHTFPFAFFTITTLASQVV